jgi:hypothetical protein
MKTCYAQAKIDKAREERIQNEIIVDCYNESERFSEWYCYLEEKLKFRLCALCFAAESRKASRSHWHVR